MDVKYDSKLLEAKKIDKEKVVELAEFEEQFNEPVVAGEYHSGALKGMYIDSWKNVAQKAKNLEVEYESEMMKELNNDSLRSMACWRRLTKRVSSKHSSTDSIRT